MKKNRVYILLHDIRSTHNVGSIFRTSDAVGVSKIYLSGYTPKPIDKFERPRKDIAKVALGAEKTVPWEYVSSPLKLLKDLKKEKFTVIALEQSKNSVDYKKIKVKGDVVFVVGNEVLGTDNEILKLADKVAEIPMEGNKESLNVSVAFGVGVFRILDK